MDIDFDDVPKRHNRSLAELYAASQALLQEQQQQQEQRQPVSGISDAATTVGAKELLGSSYYYNPLQLTTATATVTQTSSASASTPSRTEPSSSLSYEDQILSNLAQRTTELTRQHIHALVESQMQRGWERDREVWLQELTGTKSRNLGGAASSTFATTTTTTPNNRDRHPFAQIALPSTPQPRPGTGTLLTAPLSSSSFSQQTTLSPAHLHVDATTVKDHLTVVRNKLVPLPTTAAYAPSSLSDAMNAFLNLPTVVNGQSPIDAGYRTAWELLLYMSNTNTPTSPIDQAKASLVCWTLQFRQHVVTTIQRPAWQQQQQQQQHQQHGQAKGQAHAPYKSEMANACKQYVKLVLGTTTSSKEVWQVAYYCLRCGDAMAAREVLLLHVKDDTSATVDPAVIRLLESYAREQGDAPTVWASDTLTRLNPNDLLAVRDLPPALVSGDLFQSGFLALLACSPLPSASEDAKAAKTIGFCNIEDYLTSQLWQALLDSSSNNNSATTPETKLAELGSDIRGLGTMHFGTSEAWSYSLPLLATQQYAQALENLVRVGGEVGLLQACHLALALNFLGIDVNNLEDHAATAAAATATADKRNATTSRESFLIVKYANMIFPVAGALGALEYVVRIPSKDRDGEVSRLIVKADKNALAELVGVLNEQGLRVGGAQCLNTFGLDINRVLTDAADMLLNDHVRVTRDTTAHAVMCYMLAERYDEVLNLLSKCISPPENNNNNDDPDRQFWVDQTNSFHEYYLRKRTHVLHVLENTSPNAIVTNNTLLLLNQYFSSVKLGNSAEAWQILERVNLLPRSQMDISTKEAAYKTHSHLVQNAMPALIGCAVRSLFQEHQSLLHRQHNDDVARIRLAQIKQQSKLYVKFASMIGVVNAEMLQLEGLMS